MTSNLQRWMLAILCVAAPVFSACAAEHTKDSLQTVKENVTGDKAVLVDVREKSEWDRGHVSGAVFLPLSELNGGTTTAAALQKQLPKGQIVYTHCVVGKRSLAAAEILQKHGYDVRPLKAGYADLLRAGFEKAGK